MLASRASGLRSGPQSYQRKNTRCAVNSVRDSEKTVSMLNKLIFRL